MLRVVCCYICAVSFLLLLAAFQRSQCPGSDVDDECTIRSNSASQPFRLANFGSVRRAGDYISPLWIPSVRRQIGYLQTAFAMK